MEPAATTKTQRQGQGQARSLEVKLANSDLAGRIEAFLDSEREYVETSLRPLTELEKRLKVHIAQDKAILNELEISEVFLDSTAIYDFTNGMYDKLNKARWAGLETFLVEFPAIVDKLIPFFKLYQSFVQKSKKAITRCTELINNNKTFKEFLTLNEAIYGKTMLSLLSSPMNHLPLYLQYFLVISGAPDVSDAVRPAIEATAMKIVDITNYISLSCQRTTSREKVVEIQENVFKSNVALLDPSRGLVREGTCKLVGPKSSQDHVFYLFSDFIGWVDKGVFSTSFGSIMQMGGLRITPTVSDVTGVKSSFKIKNVITNNEWWIACESDKIRDRWVDDLCRAISEYYSLNEKNSNAQLKMLHPDEFEKKIRKKRFDDNKVIERPPPEFPSGYTSTGERIVGPRPPTKPKPSSPSNSSVSRSAPARPPRKPSTSSTRSVPSTPSGGFRIHTEPEEEYVFAPEKPPAVIGDWERLTDPGSGRFYYENIPLQITQWDPPQVFLDWRPEKAARPPAVPEDRVPAFFPNAESAAPPQPPVHPPSFTPSTPQPPAHPTGPPAFTPGPPQPPAHIASPPQPPTHKPAPPSIPPVSAGPPAMPPSFPSSGGPPISPLGRAPGGEGLLSAIRGGATLKSVDATPSPSHAAGGNNLLSAIQSRPQLRKVSDTPTPKAAPAVSGGGIGEALQKSLANYRKFVQDEDDDDDEDDEW